jgi:hypothetical protein
MESRGTQTLAEITSRSALRGSLRKLAAQKTVKSTFSPSRALRLTIIAETWSALPLRQIRRYCG